MKKIKRLASFFLVVILVMSNLVSVMAAKGDNGSSSSTTYNHIAIAIGMEGDGNWTLDDKPTVVATGGQYNNKDITLNKAQSSQKNGKEYQSNMNYKFTTATTFTITAKFTNGKETKTETFVISDISNYKDSGKSFYQYCKANYCDGNSGIDMKLSYTELVENFYDVVYDVEGDYGVVVDDTDYKEGDTVTVKNDIPVKTDYVFAGWQLGEAVYTAGNTFKMPAGSVTLKALFTPVAKYSVAYNLNGGTGNIADSNLYREGDTVTVKNDVPVRDGFKFNGWTYAGETYTAGEQTTMGTSNIEFVAKWVTQYTISFYVNDILVGTKIVDEGTDVTNMLEYNYDGIKDSEMLSDWVVETKDANFKQIDKDIVVRATTSLKQYKVIYYVDGEKYTEDTVDYGSKVDVTKKEYVPDESKNFSGWKITEGDVDNVTSDIIVNGNTTVKKYTITYYVGDDIVEVVEGVEHGNSVALYEYTPEMGYDFTGFEMITEGGSLENVTKNLILKGTVSLKEYTVTFLDEDGKELSSVVYKHGDQALEIKKPTKADLKIEGADIQAQWIKYSFKAWNAEDETYTLEDLNIVTQDMTFRATYNANEQVVKYYVLNRGLLEPKELSSYDKKNYSNGSVGGLHFFKKIANDYEAVKANLVSIPTAFTLYNSTNPLVLNDGEYIKWYVVKLENDNWHVDGIIANQMYNLTVNYLEKGTTNKLAESTTESKAAETEYTVVPKDIEGYTVDGTIQEQLTNTMPYGDVVINIYYTKNSYELTVEYVYKNDNSKAADTNTQTLEFGAEYSVKSPVIAGYTASIENVAGTMPAKNMKVVVEYDAVDYTLTIRYSYTDGTQASASYTETLNVNDRYSVASPVINGYSVSKQLVTGTMPAANVVLDVVYSINEYVLTITYQYEDGTVIGNHIKAYNFGDDYSVVSDEKEGYTVDKSVVEGKMPANNVNEVVTYTKNQYNLTIEYEYEDGTSAGDTYTKTLDYEAGYNVTTPQITGFTADQLEVTGTMPAEDVIITVVYTANNYNLVIEYVYEDGTPAGEAYRVILKYGDEYSVESADIEGFNVDKAVVNGNMPAGPVVETVTYSPIMFTVTYIVDGIEYRTFEVKYGDIIDINNVIYTPEEGMIFSGWEIEDNVNIESGIKSDITVIGTTSEIVEVEPDDDPLDPGDEDDKDDKEDDEDETVDVVIDEDPLDVPKTGDDLGAMPYVYRMLIAMTALGVVVFFGKRKELI